MSTEPEKENKQNNAAMVITQNDDVWITRMNEAIDVIFASNFGEDKADNTESDNIDTDILINQLIDLEIGTKSEILNAMDMVEDKTNIEEIAEYLIHKNNTNDINPINTNSKHNEKLLDLYSQFHHHYPILYSEDDSSNTQYNDDDTPNTNWNKLRSLPRIPFNEFAKALVIDNKIVIIPQNTGFFYEYNPLHGLKNVSFSKLIHTPSCAKMENFVCCYDEMDGMMYIFTDTGDIFTKHKYLYVWERQDIVQSDYIKHQFSEHECCAVINGNLHIIAGIQHLWWNKYTKELIQIKVFHGWNRSKSMCFTGIDLNFSTLIPIKSKQQLLLITANGQNKEPMTIYLYKIKNKQWEILFTGMFFDDKLTSFGSVLTNNEKFVLIFGGNNKDDIYSIDTQNFIVRKLHIKCPIKGKVFACYIPKYQQIIVNGFIRECWKYGIFQKIRLPSAEVVATILAYYAFGGDIHLFNMSTHWISTYLSQFI
eukprot:509705_1